MDNTISSYFHRIIDKIDRSMIQNIQIVSRDGRVLVQSSHEPEGISPVIIRSIIRELDVNHPRQLIYNNSGEYTVIGTPLITAGQLLGVVLVEVKNLRQGEQMIATVRTALETFIEHHQTLQEEVSATSRDEDIIHELLYSPKNELEEQISYKLFKSLKTLGFDLFLLRSVVLIELEKKTNTYFNINLDLGYESSIETFKNKVVGVIKANKFLNNQDVVAFYDNNHIVVLKGFLDVGNIGKLYFALDNICHAIMSDLDTAKIFAYRIAYGGICNNLFAVKKSFQEAKDTIRLGSIFQEDHGIYTAYYGLLEHVSYYLPSILKQKTVQHVLIKLKKADGSIDLNLLFIAEAFVDQCMNLVKTANTLHLHRNTVAGKIERFKLKTGLDPEKNFKDAFLTKMTALTVKTENLGQVKSDQFSNL